MLTSAAGPPIIGNGWLLPDGDAIGQQAEAARASQPERQQEGGPSRQASSRQPDSQAEQIATRGGGVETSSPAAAAAVVLVPVLLLVWGLLWLWREACGWQQVLVPFFVLEEV